MMRALIGMAMVVALAEGAFAQDQGEVITKQYDDGSVYEGTFLNGLQDGTGTACGFYRLDHFPGTGERMARYEAEAPALASLFAAPVTAPNAAPSGLAPPAMPCMALCPMSVAVGG